MRAIAYFRSLMTSLFRGSRVEREMDEELRLHIENRAEDLVKSGLDREEADRRARVEFGGYQKYREESREALGVPIWERLIQDLRFGLRMLRKSPGFTAVTVLTLALGIGANAAIFTVINAVMIRMLPVQDPEQLVAIGNPSQVHSWSTGTPQTNLFSYPLYREVRDRNEVFTAVLAGSHIGNLRINVSGAPEKATGRLVTENYFETLGVKALIGRIFTEEDGSGAGADPYAVISYGYWQRRFSGDPGTIGRRVRLNGYPFTIIGVTPPGFFGEVVGDRDDIWVPMLMEPQVSPGRDFLKTANTSSLLLIGRLRANVTVAQAKADVESVVKQALTETLSPMLSADDREAMKKGKFSIEVSPGGRGLSRLRSEFSSPLLLLSGLVGLVLLVACVNVANLMLARSAARERELAVRLAMGATRRRIFSQLLTEAVLLSVLGGACGLLAAEWGAIALVRMANQTSRDPLVLSLDWRVLGFTAGVSIVVGVLFGLAPAFRFAKADLQPTLKEGGRDAAIGARRGRAGGILLSSQIALGVLVLIAAGLFVHSLRNLQEANLGYSRDHLVMARVDPTASGYKEEEVPALTHELIERLAMLPGVRGATASANGLFSGSESADLIHVEGYSSTKDQDLVTYDDEIGPNYFSTIGEPMVLGREINDQDYQRGAKVIVINESFAKFYFGDRNPIGHKVSIPDSDHPNAPPFEIIGVARDVRDQGPQTPVRRRMYAPMSSAAYDAGGAVNLEVRAIGNPEALVNEIREKIRSQDANLLIDKVTTENELVNDTLLSQILVAKLSTLFGALVLILVCVGLYGSMSYGVARRTREIGVRMALGASRGAVVWMVTQEACMILAIGAGAGIAGGIAATQFFKSMLFGVSAMDPAAIGISVAMLMIIAFAAAILPARRATRVDPMIALRYE